MAYQPSFGHRVVVAAKASWWILRYRLPGPDPKRPDPETYELIQRIADAADSGRIR